MPARQPFRKSGNWKSITYYPYTSVLCHSSATPKNYMDSRRSFWKWLRWKSIGFCLLPPSTCISSLKLKFQASLTYALDTMPPIESRIWKIRYGHQAAILKVTSLKINRLLPIHIRTVPLKFGVDIESQSKVRVWKPKSPIWPPGGHF